MRGRTAGVLGLLLVMAVAGCGGTTGTGGVATAGGTAAPTASTAADGMTEQERALAFGRCMRENGVPDFEDPTFNEGGGMSISAPEGADPSKIDAAMAACKPYLPNGGEPVKIDPERLEQLRAMSRCMRENGVPDFPDPTDQGIQIDGNKPELSPDNPTFQAARDKCSRYAPAPPGQSPGLQTRENG